MTDVIDELQCWLDSNWDPDMTVARVVGTARHGWLVGAVVAG